MYKRQGSYYVVEKTAPEGFVLNHDRSEVAFVYANQDTPVIEQEVTVGDDRQKVAIQVEKQDAENGATVAGAVFGIYNKAEYLGVNASSFSSYGSEKRGSPVKAFIRYCDEDKEITVNTPVTRPHLLCLLYTSIHIIMITNITTMNIITMFIVIYSMLIKLLMIVGLMKELKH